MSLRCFANTANTPSFAWCSDCARDRPLLHFVRRTQTGELICCSDCWNKRTPAEQADPVYVGPSGLTGTAAQHEENARIIREYWRERFPSDPRFFEPAIRAEGYSLYPDVKFGYEHGVQWEYRKPGPWPTELPVWLL